MLANNIFFMLAIMYFYFMRILYTWEVSAKTSETFLERAPMLHYCYWDEKTRLAIHIHLDEEKTQHYLHYH